jgi:hypothetical protein
VDVALRTREVVSDLAASIGHKQFLAYSDQLNGKVFLNGARPNP